MNPVDSTLEQGVSFLQVREYSDAAKIFANLVKLNDKNLSAWFYLGVSCRFLGDWLTARAAFYKTLKLDPNHDEAHFELALLLSLCDDRVGAMIEIEKAIRIRPQAVYFKLMTNLFVDVGQLHTAIGLCRIAKEHFPEDLDFSEQIANMSEIQNDLETAFAERLYLLTKRSQAGDHVKLGLYYWAKNQPIESKNHFIKALEINPKCIEAIKNLSFLAHHKTPGVSK